MSQHDKDNDADTIQAIKRMGAKDFRELGYLQEVNRCFLHPLGLALEVLVDEDGCETFGQVWDFRFDPEGILYSCDLDADKAERINRERADKLTFRAGKYGIQVQPVDDSWALGKSGDAGD